MDLIRIKIELKEPGTLRLCNALALNFHISEAEATPWTKATATAAFQVLTVYTSLHISGMKELMGFMTARFT